jgi:outer membrane protein assembly factor BamB
MRHRTPGRNRYYNGVGAGHTTICSGRSTGDRPTVALSLTLVLLCTAVVAAGQIRRSETDERALIAIDARWTVPLATAPSAMPGFDARAAYVPLKGGELISVSLDNGAVLWKVELTTAFTPATGDGFVFVAGDGLVIAFEDRTGTTAWRTPVGGEIAGPVHFDAGLLIVTKSDGELLALRGQDGAVAWRRPIGGPVTVAPTSFGDRLYVALSDGRVLAIHRDSGESLWEFAAGAAVTGMLALEDQVVIGTRGSRVYSLQPDRARIRWQWRVGASVAGAPVADDRRIYIAALDNVLRALDRGNGNMRWTARLPSRPAGGPLRTGDVVIVPTASATIGAYLVDSGKESFTIKAVGELGGVPFLRETPLVTAPRLVALTRESAQQGFALQGFAARHEPPPTALDGLPGGSKIGGN